MEEHKNWKRFFKPQRVNRLQFLAFFVLSNIVLAAGSALGFFWLLYPVCIFVYLKYAAARVRDWEGKVKAWIASLIFLFGITTMGIVQQDPRMAGFYTLFYVLLAVCNLTLIFQRGKFTNEGYEQFKTGLGDSVRYYKERFRLNREKRKLEKQAALEKLRCEVESLKGQPNSENCQQENGINPNS